MATQSSKPSKRSNHPSSHPTAAFATQSGQQPTTPFMAMLPASQNEELQPTHDALVDVYNRDFPQTTASAFYFND
jgi:hypothetical protein